MNMIHGGKLEVFQPKMFFEQKNITFIRPLIYSKEKEISKTAKQEQLPIIKSTCPNDGYSERQRVKELLQNIYDETPQAQNNFLKMLSNEKQLKLWQKEK